MASTADISALRDELLQTITSGSAEHRAAMSKLRTQVTTEMENLTKQYTGMIDELNKLKGVTTAPDVKVEELEGRMKEAEKKESERTTAEAGWEKEAAGIRQGVSNLQAILATVDLQKLQDQMTDLEANITDIKGKMDDEGKAEDEGDGGGRKHGSKDDGGDEGEVSRRGRTRNEE